MESMSARSQRMEALRCRTRELTDALGVLGKAFAQEAELLHRHDQARGLDELEKRVAQEAEDSRHMERVASHELRKARLISGATKFALGTLAAALAGSREQPLYVGARLARGDFRRADPFGTVLVAVGLGGMPGDVKVISVSRLARESSLSESQTVASVEAQGYRLMPPETFFSVLAELKKNVLDGAVTVPMAAAHPLPKQTGRSNDSSMPPERRPVSPRKRDVTSQSSASGVTGQNGNSPPSGHRYESLS